VFESTARQPTQTQTEPEAERQAVQRNRRVTGSRYRGRDSKGRRRGATPRTSRALASSTRLAGLVGPTLIALTVTETINLDIWKTNVAPATYLNGVLLFAAGLALVRAHNRWVRAWPVLLTLLGWLGMAAGLFRMAAPKAQQGARTSRPTSSWRCSCWSESG
jgi:hypothetical protein